MNHLALQSTAAVIPVRLAVPDGIRDPLPPTSVKATIYKKADTTTPLVAETAQTIVSFTLDGAISDGDEDFTVTSWGAFRVPQPGDALLLCAASDPEQNPREVVTVESVSGLTITTREEIEQAYSDEDKCYPQTQRIALTATHTATIARLYRIRMEATYDGLPTAEATIWWDDLFDVVAHVPRNPLTLDALRTEAGSMFHDLEGYADQAEGGFTALTQRAFEATMDDLWQRGMKPDLVIADSQLRPLCFWHLCDMGTRDHVIPTGWSAPEWAEEVDKRRKRALSDFFARIEAIDADQDLTIDDNDESQRCLDIGLSQ